MKEFILKEKTEFITLVKFLKIEDYIQSGGECHYFIDNNDILLNNKKVTEKRKKIYSNDILQINNDIIKIKSAT